MEFLSLMDVVGDDPTSLNRAILNDLNNYQGKSAEIGQFGPLWSPL